MRKFIGVNERGLRVGQDHQRAKLTDRDVELIRALHDEGMQYVMIAEKFEVSHHTVARICRHERRNTPVARWKPIKEGNTNGTASVENHSPARAV